MRVLKLFRHFRHVISFDDMNHAGKRLSFNSGYLSITINNEPSKPDSAGRTNCPLTQNTVSQRAKVKVIKRSEDGEM